jgi:hypothetical protein
LGNQLCGALYASSTHVTDATAECLMASTRVGYTNYQHYHTSDGTRNRRIEMPVTDGEFATTGIASKEMASSGT